ncbi:hypothetical protein Peur_041702 [Populus x canadensis]
MGSINSLGGCDQEERLAKRRRLNGLDIKTFETIIPSCLLSFRVPNPVLSTHLLRVAVLNSPIQLIESPQSSCFKLLLSSPEISQLILIGNNQISSSDSSLLTYHKRDNTQYVKSLENSLEPLFFALSPKVSVKDEIFDCSVSDNVLIHLH